MPSKTIKKKPAAALPSIPKELIEQFVRGPMSAEAVNAASMAFKKALIERVLGAELSHHLGYPPGAEKPDEVSNHRNGVTLKTVLTEDGPLRIDMPEALGEVFPATTLQTCIVHLIRNSLDYASWKDRKALAAAIKPIYTAPSAEAALAELDAFALGAWGQKFPTVAAAWRRAWERVIPFFAFPPAIRRVIYTTNAIESINARLRKIIKTRGHFPSDDAATKLIWLALRNITAD